MLMLRPLLPCRGTVRTRKFYGWGATRPRRLPLSAEHKSCRGRLRKRVESATGAVTVGGLGVAVAGGFRIAGASLPAMAPFPVAALRTGQADLPHPALQWDHAFRTRNTLATAGSR